FGDSNTGSEVDTKNTGSDVDGKENVYDGDGIENVDEGIGEVIALKLMETQNMLARDRLDLPVSLWFASLRGDALLLRNLLKRGLDANESENIGRTTLFLKGNSSFVP
ncbi:hypothetical protein Tco_1473295, partial [Tanacetum coccineum]